MSDAVSDRDFRALVTDSPVPVLLHFAGTEPDVLTDLLDAAGARFGGALRVGTLSAGDNPGLCARYGIIAPPVLVLFQHGQDVARRTGRGLTQAELIDWLIPFAEGACGCDRCR